MYTNWPQNAHDLGSGPTHSWKTAKSKVDPPKATRIVTQNTSNSVGADAQLFMVLGGSRKSSKSTCSCSKAQNFQIGEFVKQLGTLSRVVALRGIPVRRDGTLRLLEMYQLSRGPKHTGAGMSKYLGKRGAHQVNFVFRQDITLGDSVEIVVREMLRLQRVQILAVQKLS